jgi:hypothetical protein
VFDAHNLILKVQANCGEIRIGSINNDLDNASLVEMDVSGRNNSARDLGRKPVIIRLPMSLRSPHGAAHELIHPSTAAASGRILIQRSRGEWPVFLRGSVCYVCNLCCPRTDSRVNKDFPAIFLSPSHLVPPQIYILGVAYVGRRRVPRQLKMPGCFYISMGYTRWLRW